MNRLGLVLIVVFIAAIAGGVATFARVLDPGRSEANGIELNLLVGVGHGVLTNDWFTGQSGVVTSPAGSRLRVHAGPEPGYQLVSRPLPVYTHRHYVVSVRWHASKVVDTGVGIADLNATRYLTTKPIGRNHGSVTTVVAFDTGSQHRVTIVLYTPAGATLELTSANLKPSS
jgi:hypothetical protein